MQCSGCFSVNYRAVSLMSPDVLFKRSDVTEKWLKGNMSNFDYLMYLNTIAGTSRT